MERRISFPSDKAVSSPINCLQDQHHHRTTVEKTREAWGKKGVKLIGKECAMYCLNHKFTDTPKHITGGDPAHQKDKIQPHSPEYRHQSPPPGSLNNPLNQIYLLGADTKNNGNYEPAGWEKVAPNTVS